MKLLRRFCLLIAIMFWQGGFMFYGAVVVPVGSEVLGSHQAQGFVTRSVTNYLNLAGAVAIAIWMWELASARNNTVARQRLRWALWLVLPVTLGLLAWLHGVMDQQLDIESQKILDRERLRYLHAWYLNISTFQWASSLLLLALTLLNWQGEDGPRMNQR
ncbi:MAG TPA: hypothetical protein PLN21_08600 [Gemmatales bacterium]|nr:hypothetical protein [Gemmatales bacterium]